MQYKACRLRQAQTYHINALVSIFTIEQLPKRFRPWNIFSYENSGGTFRIQNDIKQK
jgi:hypothetical protein